MTTFDQSAQSVDRQINVGRDVVNVHYNLYAVSLYDAGQKSEIQQVCWHNLRLRSDLAQHHFALGLLYLDSEAYGRAIGAFNQSHKSDRNASALYYLSVATIGYVGKRARRLRKADVQKIEGDLTFATSHATVDHAHFWYLWAVVKYDYYVRGGLIVRSPSLTELLARANEHHARTSDPEALVGEINQMLKHVKDPERLIRNELRKVDRGFE